MAFVPKVSKIMINSISNINSKILKVSKELGETKVKDVSMG
jgi:hypothetical protein